MKHIPLLLLTGTLGLVACGAGDEQHAEPAAADAPSTAARYADGDRDGKVTREEALADPMLSASFDRYDTDDNDELDRAEFSRLEARTGEPRSPDPKEADAPDAAARSPLRPRDEYPRPQD